MKTHLRPYKWVTQNASKIGGDARRIAAAGKSVGRQPGCGSCAWAKQQGVKVPVHILSVYPIVDGDVQSQSYEEYANAKPLNPPLMEWFFNHYAPNWQTQSEPLISLIIADLSGSPATTIINAEN